MGTIEGFQPSFDGEGNEAEAPGPARITKLFGSTTSPYTRKIRILLRAAGMVPTFVDTRTEEGATALARVAPLGKIPVVELSPAGEGAAAPGVIADSGLIAAWLWSQHAPELRA